MKRILASIALSALSAAPFTAHAQFAKIEDAVRYRQAVLRVMATHLGRVAAVAKGAQPYDKATVENDVAVIAMMAKLPWSAFPTGSDIPQSKAKPEIWQEQDKFKAASEKLQGEVAKLSTAAHAGDLAAIKIALGAVGQSCKSCHDSFRNR